MKLAKYVILWLTTSLMIVSSASGDTRRINVVEGSFSDHIEFHDEMDGKKGKFFVHAVKRLYGEDLRKIPLIDQQYVTHVTLYETAVWLKSHDIKSFRLSYAFGVIEKKHFGMWSDELAFYVAGYIENSPHDNFKCDADKKFVEFCKTYLTDDVLKDESTFFWPFCR